MLSAAIRKWPDPLRAYAEIIRLDRPIGTLLLLWPTLAALWTAGRGSPDPWLVFVFALGCFLTRCAGCAINDFADRHIDGHVKRTRMRPLAVGRIPAHHALVLAAVMFLLAFLLVLTTNRLTIVLSFAALAIACIYPFTKRVFSCPQIVMGLAFSMGIPMAFSAQTNGVPNSVWLLFAANTLWALAYDTQYAMVDRDDDIRIGVRSSAILFGSRDRTAIVVAQAGMLSCLAIFAAKAMPGPGFWIGIPIIAALFVRQRLLIHHREREKCLSAFLDNNLVGAVLFASVVAGFATSSW